MLIPCSLDLFVVYVLFGAKLRMSICRCAGGDSVVEFFLLV